MTTGSRRISRCSIELAACARHAEARSKAEQLFYERRHDLWLLKGPGRERRGEPGWGDEHPANGPAPAPVRVTFDIIRASGGILPRAMREDWRSEHRASEDVE